MLKESSFSATVEEERYHEYENEYNTLKRQYGNDKDFEKQFNDIDKILSSCASLINKQKIKEEEEKKEREKLMEEEEPAYEGFRSMFEVPEIKGSDTKIDKELISIAARRFNEPVKECKTKNELIKKFKDKKIFMRALFPKEDKTLEDYLNNIPEFKKLKKSIKDENKRASIKRTIAKELYSGGKDIDGFKRILTGAVIEQPELANDKSVVKAFIKLLKDIDSHYNSTFAKMRKKLKEKLGISKKLSKTGDDKKAGSKIKEGAKKAGSKIKGLFIKKKDK